jgi:hypothetical protein
VNSVAVVAGATVVFFILGVAFGLLLLIALGAYRRYWRRRRRLWRAAIRRKIKWAESYRPDDGWEDDTGPPRWPGD